MSKPPTSKSLSQPLYLDHILYQHPQISHSAFYLENPGHEAKESVLKHQQDQLSQTKNNLFYSLLAFRQHVAKMQDKSVQKILPSPVLDRILKNSKISVFQISSLYEDSGYPSAGLELCKRIYDVIQLNEELTEDEQKLQAQLFLKQLNRKKQNGDHLPSITKLLQDIHWGDSSQWLNCKDDPSLKFYKHIISISELDYSLGQDYVGLMKNDIIRKGELGKYIKYAQYMRSKDYEKLENLYKMSLLIKQGHKQDEFSQQTEIQTKASIEKSSPKLYDDDEADTRKSSTSLEQKVMKRMQERSQQRVKSAFMKNQSLIQIHNIEESSENTESRKSSGSSWVNINNEIEQENIKRSDIKPLPDTIQQIYQMALEGKSKAERKSHKNKQKKEKSETIKEMDFMPTWEDIQKLINFTHNIK